MRSPYAVALALALAACTRETPAPGRPAADQAPPQPQLVAMDTAAAAGTLAGTWEWLWTETPVERIVPDDPAKYTLELREDGTAGGLAECNRFRGTYTVEGQSLTFSPLATTRKACVPPGGRGDWYARSLGYVRHHFFSGPDTLRMDMQADGGTFTFRRVR